MKVPFKRLLLALMLLMAAPALLIAQENKPKKTQKKADQKKEANIEKQKKGEIKGRKRHMALQTKEVRKRMKKHSRYVKSQQLNRKRGFFYRLFHGNEH
jgi:hypothetical protein